MDSAGIDYHVSLMANAFQKCLDIPELQPELLCALVKQTTPHILPQSKGQSGQSNSGGGVQVKRQHSIKHPRVSRFICFQVSLCHENGFIFIIKRSNLSYKTLNILKDIFMTNVLLNCCISIFRVC